MRRGTDVLTYVQSDLTYPHTSEIMDNTVHTFICMCHPCCDKKRYIHICILNIRTGPEIAVCHVPLSTYMYNTTKVTSLFDVCMLGMFGT